MKDFSTSIEKKTIVNKGEKQLRSEVSLPGIDLNSDGIVAPRI